RYADALAEARISAGLRPPGRPIGPLTLGLTGYLYAMSGDTAAARTALEQLRAHPVPGSYYHIGLGYIYLGLGEKEHALSALERAFSSGPFRQAFRAIVELGNPISDPVRADPRFVQLTHRLGLPHRSSRRPGAAG